MNKSEKLRSIRNTDALRAVLNEVNRPFTSVGRGTNEGELINGLLAPTRKSILVDGQVGTTGTIPGITDIRLVADPKGLFSFVIEVDGACPEGEWDNRMEFTDRSGDTYTLRIFGSTPDTHTVNYNSPDGAIINITWSI